jgi:hypothetical protein
MLGLMVGEGQVSTRGGAIQHKFKIGQAIHYYGRGHYGSTAGPFVVLALLPQMQGDACYRIRSQNNRSLEYVAREDELKPITRTRRRAGDRLKTQ